MLFVLARSIRRSPHSRITGKWRTAVSGVHFVEKRSFAGGSYGDYTSSTIPLPSATVSGLG
jgi:hypothetical protein